MDDWYNSWKDGNTTYGVGSVGGMMFEDSFTYYNSPTYAVRQKYHTITSSSGAVTKILIYYNELEILQYYVPRFYNDGTLVSITQEEIDQILLEQWHIDDIGWDIEEKEEPDHKEEYDAFKGPRE